jgi:hypothetical protein
MKIKPVKRKKTGRLTLNETRSLWLELMGGEELAKTRGNQALAWNAFRIGVDIAQRGKVSANDVEIFRLGTLNPDEVKARHDEFHAHLEAAQARADSEQGA